ncbi:helix-turn-helix domain-containing protein [Gimesia maris]|uniref:helix-turn-helix domain-containing protein n=1 Tax=Gimesia maris TaxID=122 RepID=UPI0032EFEE5B
MTSTFVRVELVHISSGCCNIEFGLPRSLYDECKEEGTEFHCPKCGCSRVFVEPEKQKLKKEIERLKGRVHSSECKRRDAESQRNAARKSHRKMRDRVKNGVCPCCNRSFDNLLKHMKSKHPEYGNNQTLKQLRETYGLTQSDLADELGVSVNHVSSFECGKSVTSWARDQIETWIEHQGQS